MQSIMFDNLSICVPAFNEAESISGTIAVLAETYPSAQIIIVDDFSDDDTYAIAKRFKNITLLAHTRNMGYGASLKTAMNFAERDVLVWFDGDGQHRVEDLKKVVQPVLENKYDAVIGVRRKGSDFSPRRMPGKFFLKFMAEIVAMQKIPDLNSGLRCFNSEVIKRYIHLLPDGFSASSTSTLLMMMRGYRLGYVDIMTHKRYGQSTVNVFKDGIRAIQLIFQMLMLFRAWPFFSLLSFIQIFVGLGYGLIIFYKNKLGLPVLSAIIIISGILTFFMGLVCDQIVSLRKERFEDFSLKSKLRKRNINSSQ